VFVLLFVRSFIHAYVMLTTDFDPCHRKDLD